jgi:hypothetical protein
MQCNVTVMCYVECIVIEINVHPSYIKGYIYTCIYKYTSCMEFLYARIIKLQSAHDLHIYDFEELLPVMRTSKPAKSASSLTLMRNCSHDVNEYVFVVSPN